MVDEILQRITTNNDNTSVTIVTNCDTYVFRCVAEYSHECWINTITPTEEIELSYGQAIVSVNFVGWYNEICLSDGRRIAIELRAEYNYDAWLREIR